MFLNFNTNIDISSINTRLNYFEFVHIHRTLQYRYSRAHLGILVKLLLLTLFLPAKLFLLYSSYIDFLLSWFILDLYTLDIFENFVNTFLDLIEQVSLLLYVLYTLYTSRHPFHLYLHKVSMFCIYNLKFIYLLIGTFFIIPLNISARVTLISTSLGLPFFGPVSLFRPPPIPNI